MSLCNILRHCLVLLFICYGSKKANSLETGTETVNKDHLKVVTLDDDGTLSENDSSKYDFALKGLLKNHPEYNFKSGSKCVGVKYNNEDVWVYDSTKNQKHPTSVKMDPVAQTLWVLLDTFEFYTFHFSDGKWKFNNQVSLGSCKTYDHSLSLSNLVESFKPTPTTPVEPKPSSEVKQDEKNYVEAKYGKKNFKFELEKEGQLPESVVVNLLGREYVFVTDRLNELLFKYPEVPRPLKSVEGEIKHKTLHYSHGDEHFVYKQSEDRWIRVTKSDYTKLLELTKKGQSPSSELSEAPEYKFIDLEVTCEQSEHYYCSSYSGNKTFTTKDGYLFKKITLNGETLFECEDGKRCNKVEYQPNSEVFLFVHLVNGNIMAFTNKSVT